MNIADITRALARLLACLVMPLVCVSLSTAAFAEDASRWVRAWGVALMAPEEFDYYPGLGRTFENATLRQFVHTTLAGTSLRVLISNQYGSQPLRIGSACIARARRTDRLDPSFTSPLLFNGQHTVIIPAGATIYSDPVELQTVAPATLAISLYLPDSTAGSVATVHEEGWLRGYLSGHGDFTANAELPIAASLYSYFYLAAIDVKTARPARAIVMLGDSLTDGTGSTPGAQRSWPDQLSRRLSLAMPGEFAVINMSIGGNRLLHASTGPSALSRVDRDVFSVPGARFLFLLEGINDIGGWPEHPEEDVSAAQLISALHQLSVAAHDHGLRAIVGTLMPTEGCPDCGGRNGEVIRETVNRWIRTSQEFDDVVDFDRVVRDRAHPRRLAPVFDSGDHLHLNDAGYAAMAREVDLAFFGEDRKGGSSDSPGRPK